MRRRSLHAYRALMFVLVVLCSLFAAGTAGIHGHSDTHGQVHHHSHGGDEQRPLPLVTPRVALHLKPSRPFYRIRPRSDAWAMVSRPWSGAYPPAVLSGSSLSATASIHLRCLATIRLTI